MRIMNSKVSGRFNAQDLRLVWWIWDGMSVRFGVVILLLLLWVFGLEAATATGAWSTNLTESLAEARSQRKPLLLDFSATWCGPCRMMARTTLGDEAVLRELRDWVCVAVDIDEQPKIAGQFGVNAVPTFLVLRDDGDELLRASGYMDADRFRAWLKEAALKFSAAQQRKQQFQREQEQLLAGLADRELPKRQVAIRQLFDLCAQREQSEQQFAVAQMQIVAKREPLLLLEGLGHASLATRIQVANALRAELGAHFQFDPWDQSSARASAIVQLRRQFTELERKEP